MLIQRHYESYGSITLGRVQYDVSLCTRVCASTFNGVGNWDECSDIFLTLTPMTRVSQFLRPVPTEELKVLLEEAINNGAMDTMFKHWYPVRKVLNWRKRVIKQIGIGTTMYHRDCDEYSLYLYDIKA